MTMHVKTREEALRLARKAADTTQSVYAIYEDAQGHWKWRPERIARHTANVHLEIIEPNWLQHAEHMAGFWWHRGNLADERGDREVAERHYARSQEWHDRMNELLGNGGSPQC